ncbi:MAG TPA: PEP-CTERM sorting domain-containing protein [Chthonomonadaceae bacterium]|nr:PEP-CTERM sorting domain-containing protein [Chthonomonadaceae bacterium]
MNCNRGQTDSLCLRARRSRRATSVCLGFTALGLCLLPGCKERGAAARSLLPDRGGSNSASQNAVLSSSQAASPSLTGSSTLSSGLLSQQGQGGASNVKPAAGSGAGLALTPPGSLLSGDSGNSSLGLGGGGTSPSPIGLPDGVTTQGPAPTVPEPGTLSLLLGVATSGLSLLCCRRARRR